jgi:lipoprotein-releasing system ATP-binding protein
MSKHAAPTEPAIALEAVSKSYRMGRVTLDVLKAVDLEVMPGEFVSIVGASGSGKSTMLHLIGLLDAPDQGTVHLHGRAASELSSARRNAIRCREVGFVFQFYHLMPELSVLENILLPAKVDSSIVGWLQRRGPARQHAAELAERLGIGQRLRHKPSELSGGERQRVAIARALVNRPRILLADEPTGNLDSKTGRQIMDVLRGISRELHQTMVMVTHDMELAKSASRILTLRDGRLNAHG